MLLHETATGARRASVCLARNTANPKVSDPIQKPIDKFYNDDDFALPHTEYR
jgi:hypothetical protein